MSTHPIPTANFDCILGVALVSDGRRRPEWVDLQYATTDFNVLFQQIRMEFANGCSCSGA